MGKRKIISDEENGNNLSRYVKRRLAKKNSNVDTGEMQDNEEMMKASEFTTELGLYSLNGVPSNLLIFIDEVENIDNKLENTSTDDTMETNESTDDENSSYYCQSTSSKDENSSYYCQSISSQDESETEDELYIHSENFCQPSQYLPLLNLGFYFKNNLSKKAFHQSLKLTQIATQDSQKQLQNPDSCLNEYSHLAVNIEKQFICLQKECNQILVVDSKGIPTARQPCGHKFCKEDKTCFMLKLPIKQQLLQYLQEGDMLDNNKIVSASVPNEGIRKDVSSGDCYRALVKNGNITNRTMTGTVNIDGADFFKSSQFGFWPCMAVINEVPYKKRRSNMVLMALWYGNKKPPRDSFLEFALKELKSLESDPIEFNGMKYLFRPLIVSVDTIARPIVRNSTQFNGEFGCDWCLHPGQTFKKVEKKRGHSRVYPEPVMFPTFPIRCMDQHDADLQVVLATGKPYHGICGKNSLMNFKELDHVKAEIPDYLHAVCQGIIKFFIELWTKTKYHKQPWYLNKNKRTIFDMRMKNIKPPHEITRTPSSLASLSDWKASEYRAFALYYFCVLEDLLPKIYFDHFCMFSYGLQVLLQDEVSVEKVREVEYLFSNFVRESETLYALEHIRFNLHLLTHLSQSVLDWGCLWATSTFIPEWFNGQLRSLAKGTQGVINQMASKFLIRNAVRKDALNLMTQYILPKNVSLLLEELFHIPNHLVKKKNCLSVEGVSFSLLGSPSNCKLNIHEEIALRNLFEESGDPLLSSEHFPIEETALDSYLSFPRIRNASKSSIFTTSNYTRAKKRKNNYAYMSDGSFFRIDKIMFFESMHMTRYSVVVMGRTLGSISKVALAPRGYSDLDGQTTKLKGLSDDVVAYFVDDIIKKCVVGFHNDIIDTYVVTAMPNTVETD